MLRPKSNRVTTLDNSTVIKTLLDASKLTTIPNLQKAAGLAVGIADIMQNVRSHKKELNQLASDACALVYIALRTQEKANTISAAGSPSYLENMKELADTLQSLHEFTKGQTTRNFALRVIQNKSVAGTIREYRERLRHFLDFFGLKSSISIQDTLASIQSSSKASDVLPPIEDNLLSESPENELLDQHGPLQNSETSVEDGEVKDEQERDVVLIEDGGDRKDVDDSCRDEEQCGDGDKEDMQEDVNQNSPEGMERDEVSISTDEDKHQPESADDHLQDENFLPVSDSNRDSFYQSTPSTTSSHSLPNPFDNPSPHSVSDSGPDTQVRHSWVSNQIQYHHPSLIPGFSQLPKPTYSDSPLPLFVPYPSPAGFYTPSAYGCRPSHGTSTNSAVTTRYKGDFLEFGGT
ncbi:hypothetical protein H0H92_015619 [Tricholoma furcatifolium]|nr:hypothetical protein H0H92_015619 [Tricholoma furcatifolium]